jgi:hypothetical protein
MEHGTWMKTVFSSAKGASDKSPQFQLRENGIK